MFSAAHAVAPVAGDIIFNEYVSDNNADLNDFFEILVLKNGVDLRGLRFSDNELIGGVFNNNESVFIFGNDSYLNNVPKGTIIVVWTNAINITTDVVANPAASDWKMVLAPGTGVTTSVDGLGGTINTGLNNDGEGLYLYLPGPDGNSAGTDNVYLDFLSYEGDNNAEAPAGLTDINLTSNADNAYYTGNTAAGNDVATNWTKLSNLGVNNTPGEPNPTQDLSGLRVVPPQISITEFMYSGGNGEFIEFTNVGSTNVDMTGWSFDDDSRTAGTVSLSAFGTVAPGESVILAEANAATFRTAWNLCSGIKIIGGLTTNLSRNDEINLYNNSNVLVDRLTYGDENISGSIRTQNKSGWVSAAGLGANDIFQWTLSVANDAEASVASTGGDIGSPGKSTRAIVSFNPCAPPPTNAPTIVENTSSLLVNLNANSPGSVSGVISDPTDPAAAFGIDFTINDNDTPIANLTVTASSSNTAVVTNANLNLTGSGSSRNLKITPTGVGYTNITVTVSDGPINLTIWPPGNSPCASTPKC